MAIYRVHKTKNFTTINNYLIRDENLNLKDKGMMVVLLSLPDGWNFSVVGLETICKEARNTINSILNNLQEHGYLERTKIYEKGKIKDWRYDIYEIPKNLYRKNEDIENEDIENEDIENDTQLNTNKLNTEELNTNKYIFKKPSLEEVEKYCNERHNNIDPKKFIDFYEVNNWTDSKGNKVKSWKQKVITWESHQPKTKEEKLPTWFNQEIKEKEIDDDTRKLIAEIEGTSSSNY